VNSLSILYIGRNSGTSLHRVEALRRLGNEVFLIDPNTFLPATRLSGIWTWQTGGLFLEGYIRRRILAILPAKKFDLVYVDSGELVGPALVRELKSRFGSVINYNVDDPYGARDGHRWRLYRAAVPVYDLIVVVRDCNVSEAYAAGASRVMRVHRSADEVAHAPRVCSPEEHAQWGSEVAFVGTWMPERGPFMARLVKLGLPLAIYGDRWHKAPEFPILRAFWRGAGLYDDNYAKVIQCAKVNLGLLSKGNRDLTTQRSFEIPYLGGVLCAERTPEHCALYKENEEAIFWDSPEECARKCRLLLDDAGLRAKISLNSRRRCEQNGTMNQIVLQRILDEAGTKHTRGVPLDNTRGKVDSWSRQLLQAAASRVSLRTEK
jgi:spore maturation protein CgeB